MAQLLIQASWLAKLWFEGATWSCWPLLHGHRPPLQHYQHHCHSHEADGILYPDTPDQLTPSSQKTHDASCSSVQRTCLLLGSSSNTAVINAIHSSAAW